MPVMAHLVGKDIYRRLGQSVDRTTVRMPWSDDLRRMLTALYSPAEAGLVATMPRRPSPLSRVARVTGRDTRTLRPMLDAMCKKGLVCDIWEGGQYLYMPSPFVIGFFEFSMMRTRGALDQKKWAELFQAYMFGESGFFEANFGDGQQVSIMRALPWEQTVGPAEKTGRESGGAVPAGVEHVEILDFEKASAMVRSEKFFAVGLCSCRHEKEHLGERHCEAPLETCTSMGDAARFLVRNELAREISRSEMLDVLDRSRELALTLTTDNVKKDAGFICHCCGCCCNLMRGIKHSGYPGVVVSSTCIASVDASGCVGCGKCAAVCPVDALCMVEESGGRDVVCEGTGAGAGATEDAKKRPSKLAVVDTGLCLGCGACALKCPTDALRLEKRKQKVFHPEDSFERVITQSLERGTLHHLLFDNPNSGAQGFMRAVLGGFLKLSPVRKALMSEALRSRFLTALRKGAGA